MPCAQIMAGTAAVDAEQPALCFKHCQADAGQQPPDIAQATVASAPPPALLFLLEPVARVAHEARTQAARWQRRERAPPAPLSVLHCCYRI